MIYVMLILLVFTVGSGLADEGATMKPSCTYSEGGNLHIYDCANPPMPVCYQRMREAMQWANELEKIRSGELFLEPRNRTAKWYFDGKKRFDQTVKDCVEKP